MKLEIAVSEITDIFKEIQERPGQLFKMKGFLHVGDSVGGDKFGQ